MPSVLHPSAVDKTDYARSLGYSGTRSVLVLDGRVISHAGADWFRFCASLRAARVPVAVVTFSGDVIGIGLDLGAAASGPFVTRGGAVIGGTSYTLRSALGCSDTSDALILSCRRDGLRMSDHWTQAIA